MTHTLRTTARGWVKKLYASTLTYLLFIALSVKLIVNYSDTGELDNTIIIGWFLFLIVIVASVLPLLRDKIIIDDYAISGQINSDRFNLQWKEVIAIWDSAISNEPCLYIGAPSGITTIPLKVFDEKRLRELIHLHVAPEALEKDAIKRLPGYQLQNATNGKVFEHEKESFSVDAKYTKMFGWAFSLIFGLAVVFSLRHSAVAALVFLFFFSIGAYLALISGSTEMNFDSITHKTLLGAYRIRWVEITEIEMDSSDGHLVFCGRDRRLSMIGPKFWTGKDTERMKRLFSAQIAAHGFEVKKTQKAMWRRSRNTKIKSKVL